MNATETILWGIPAGQTDRLHERVLYTQGKTAADIERVKSMAARDGWHSFRTSGLDLTAKPDFAAAVAA